LALVATAHVFFTILHLWFLIVIYTVCIIVDARSVALIFLL